MHFQKSGLFHPRLYITILMSGLLCHGMSGFLCNGIVATDGGLTSLLEKLGSTSIQATAHVYIIDNSGTISEEEYKQVQTFVKELMTQFSISADHVHPALIAYSDTDEEITTALDLIGTTTIGNSDKCEFLTAVAGIRYKGSGKNIHAALLRAESIVSSFTRDGPRKIILITDGNGQTTLTDTLVKEIVAEGIDIIAIGVGNIDRNRLEYIAGDANDVYVLNDMIMDTNTLASKVKENPSQFKPKPGTTHCNGGHECPSTRTCACGIRRGLYSCECNPGYRVDLDSCIACQLNEYNSAYGSETCLPCPENSITMDIGSTSIDQCLCVQGYEKDGDQCIDINECDLGTDDCEQLCENTDGSYICLCNAGYILNDDGKTCTDVNECELGTDDCEQLCENTEGSYICSCNIGYILNGDAKTCTACPMNTFNDGSDPNTCTPCPELSTTENTGSTSFDDCNCIPGYAMVDEQCVNAPPNITCPPDVAKTSIIIPVSVFWEDGYPIYNDDNDGTNLLISTTHESGTLFEEGQWEVTYTATDQGGLSSSCTFTVIVNVYRCTVDAIPENGAISCTSWDLGIGCTGIDFTGQQVCLTMCREGFDFESTPHALYVCHKKKDIWTYEPCYQTGSLPTNNAIPINCVETNEQDPVVGIIEFQYFTLSCTTEDGVTEIQQNLIDLLLELNAIIKENEYCDSPDCTVTNVNYYCGPTTKRSTDNILTFTISLTVYQQQGVTEGTIFEGIDDLITSVMGEIVNYFESGELNGIVTLATEPKPTIYASCADRLTLTNDKCVSCGAGSYYDRDTKECLKCPLGYFQHQTASTECIQCPDCSTTESIGATDLAFCSVLTCDQVPGCDSGWDLYDGKCYLVNTNNEYTYNEANTICEDSGATLAVIEDAEEDLYLRSYGYVDVNLWIGLTRDPVDNDQWVWTDNTEFVYSNWGDNEPNNQGGNENCVHLFNINQWTWNDRSCDIDYGFICEKHSLD